MNDKKIIDANYSRKTKIKNKEKGRKKIKDKREKKSNLQIMRVINRS